MESGKEKLQEQYILQNTAKMNLDRATEQKNERETVFAGLHAERAEIEEQLAELENNRAQIAAEIELQRFVKKRSDRKTRTSRNVSRNIRRRRRKLRKLFQRLL